LIDDTAKQSVHLKIGRLLLSASADEEIGRRLFEVVDHLNLGRSLISEEKEKLALAGFNLEAGRKAKLSTAFSSALKYFKTGLEMVGPNWSGQYALVVSLYQELAEVEYLMGNLTESQRIIDIIWDKGLDLDKAEASALSITQYTVLGKNKEAIKTAARALKLFNMGFPENNLENALKLERARVKKNIGQQPISSLIDLHETKDPEMIALIKVLMTVHTALYFDNQHDLYGWTLAKMVNLSLENGHIPETSKGYASFGNTLSASLEEYETGYEFGLLGLKLSQKYHNQSLICKNALILSMFLNHWVKYVKEAEIFDDYGYRAGHEAGELQFIGYILTYGRTLNRFHRGTNLEVLEKDLDKYLIYTRNVNHNLSTDTILGVRRLLAYLQGNLDEDQWFGQRGEERDYIAQCNENQSFAALACYQILKAQIMFLEEEPSLALECLKKAEGVIGYIKGLFTTAEFNFYYCLTLIALYEQATDREKKSFRQTISSNQAQMKVWSAHCPDNFRHKYLLVEAELERIDGNFEKAMNLYGQSFTSAMDNNFIQDGALCNELAGKFWLQNNKEEIADIYLKKALRGYQSWGALRKCQALSTKYNNLVAFASSKVNDIFDYFTNPTTSKDQIFLDFSTVLKASQAISSEIKLENLLKKLMEIVMENAGAEKGFFIVKKDTSLIVEVQVLEGTEWVYPSSPISNGFNLSTAIVNYVARTGEDIVLDNASEVNTFHNDPYILDKKPKSVMCIPIFNLGKITALIYLENNQAPCVFTSRHLELIKTIVSQASISLENANMYNSLAESERNYRSLFENAVEGIFRTTVEGNFLRVNPAAAKMLGYSCSEEFLESNIRATDLYVDPQDRARLFEIIESRGQVSDFETLFYKKDGRKFYVLLSARAKYDREGEIQYLEGCFLDINERKEKEQAENERKIAEESSKAKSQFLANMSHEIRTPMNAIIGLTYLAMKTQLTSKQYEYLENIKNASHSLLGIINDILDFSKIEAGKLKIESVDFSLDEVLDSLSRTVGHQAHEKNLEFLIDINNKVPNYLIGDPLRLAQVLTNLCTNAVKFTRYGEVVVRVRLADERQSDLSEHLKLQFDVKDTGIGVSPDQQKNLFQRFSQADISTTRKYGGTGLGLSICQQLTKLTGGEIWMKSTPGQGSTFSFTANFGIQVNKKQENRILYQYLSKLKILVVDDNPTSRVIFKDMLNFCPHVSQAASAQEAISDIKSSSDQGSPYDLVLMDWKMPGMNGIEAIKKINSDRDLGSRKPAIVLVTAYDHLELKEKAEAVGAKGCLCKPVNISKLLDIIAELFGQARVSMTVESSQETDDLAALQANAEMKVLLVEDNEINQQVDRELLNQAGLKVYIAEDGVQCLEKVKMEDFKLILMDIQMPEMDGYKTTEELRKLGIDLPIIAMTAHAMTGERKKCLAAGMDDYISKPIDPPSLYAKLVKWLPPSKIRNIESQPRDNFPTKDRQQKDTELPEQINGIDLKTGLTRVANNKKLYKELLISFKNKYAFIGDEIKQELEKENYKTVKLIAHTLKGMAGNLGTTALYDAAAALEKSILDEEIDKHDELIHEFDKVTKLLIQGLSCLQLKDDLEQNSGFLPRKTQPVDGQKIKPLLAELERLLNSDIVAATDILGDLEASLASSVVGEKFKILKEQVESFDTVNALHTLSDITRQIVG
jgi:PAS domain S-box-containing protein